MIEEVEETTVTEPVQGTIPATFERDKFSGKLWLTLTNGRPERWVIEDLKKKGWRWGPAKKGWYNAGRYASEADIPECIQVENLEAFSIEYTQSRPARLRYGALLNELKAEALADKSDAIIEERLPSGIVIHGHRAGRQQEKALGRAERLMEQAQETAEHAVDLHKRSDRSSAHQAHRQTPQVIQRYIAEIEKDIRRHQKDRDLELYYYRRKQSRVIKTPEDLVAYDERHAARLKIMTDKLAFEQQRLADAGGPTTLKAEVGDLVLISGQMMLIESVGRTRYKCKCYPREWGWRPTYAFSDLQAVYIRASGEPVSPLPHNTFLPENAYTWCEEHGIVAEEYFAPKPEPKPEYVNVLAEREYKVDSVQEVTIDHENRFAFWPTPTELGAMLLSDGALLAIPEDAWDCEVLEPSAGIGMLADVVRADLESRDMGRQVHVCEINPEMQQSLRNKGYDVVGTDFLDYVPSMPYKAIIMNPPYTASGDPRAWCTHFMHAWNNCLAEGGVIKAIVPATFTFGQDRIVQRVREIVEEYGSWVEAPEDAFKEMGTGVKTILISAAKP